MTLEFTLAYIPTTAGYLQVGDTFTTIGGTVEYGIIEVLDDPAPGVCSYTVIDQATGESSDIAVLMGAKVRLIGIKEAVVAV